VQGYGNGTNDVHLEEAEQHEDAMPAAGATTNRSPSTSSNSSNASKSTADSGIAPMPASSPHTNYSGSSWLSDRSSKESLCDNAADDEEHDATVCPGPDIPRRSSSRKAMFMHSLVELLPPLEPVSSSESPEEPSRDAPPPPPPRRRLPTVPALRALVDMEADRGRKTPPLPRKNSKRTSLHVTAQNQNLAADSLLATPSPNPAPRLVSMPLPLRVVPRRTSTHGTGSRTKRASVARAAARRSIVSIPDDPDAWQDAHDEWEEADCEDEREEDGEEDVVWGNDDDIQPAWEQFADLGGLTPVGGSELCARYV
jgi:hypothetical protein